MYHMKEASFIVVGVGDIFPTWIDLRDHLMLLHFLVPILSLDLFLVYILDLELDPFLVVKQKGEDQVQDQGRGRR